MAEEKSSGSSNLIGRLAPVVGIAGWIAILSLGPIDLGRSVYHQIIGNIHVLKRELLDYTRRDIQRSNPNYTAQQIESILATGLRYKLGEDKLNPQDVSLEKLWDASEDHARSWYQRWVWPSLDD